MYSSLTRRGFLKLSGAAVAALGFPLYPPGGNPYLMTPSLRLGRTTRSLHYYQSPKYSSEELGFYNTDSVVQIYEERIGEQKWEQNPIWIKTDDGWINSTYVQPVRREINEPVLDILNGGMLVEVTVPYTQAWLADDERRRRSYRYYYGSTHWVYYAFRSSNGNIWYRVLDDRSNKSHLVLGQHMRPITPEELIPISPDVKNKHLEVDLTNQKVTAYQNTQPVYRARIASGYFEGTTPIGEFKVERKQPSRHMAARTEESEFDLPGVPWVCYISWTGVSLHGTYWHNNYGTPQSHGCINLSPEAAKWVYRWTEPYVAIHDDYKSSDHGTKVVIF